MAKLAARSSCGSAGVVLGCLLLALPARAQTSPPEASPLVLERSVANKLVLKQPRPQYPALARLNYIHGQVRLQVRVTREGRVAEAHVIHGHPFLAVPALEAVRSWTYRPLPGSSGAVEFLTVVELNFSLTTKKIQLMPPHAERDLHRQVKPPELLERPSDPGRTSQVRLRVLVDEEGRVVDAQPLDSAARDLQAAQREVKSWIFRPARWGAVPVPWYVDVDVPVSQRAISRTLAEQAEP